MIYHGTETHKLSASIKGKREVIRGYYLCLPNGERHWFCEERDYGAFEQACNKLLSAEHDWQYSVDYCYGYDVHGCLAWANLELTKVFC